MLIGLIIAPRAPRLLRDAANVLLEAAPSDVDLDAIREHITGSLCASNRPPSTSKPR